MFVKGQELVCGMGSVTSFSSQLNQLSGALWAPFPQGVPMAMPVLCSPSPWPPSELPVPPAPGSKAILGCLPPFGGNHREL